MSFRLTCNNRKCHSSQRAKNIVDLISNYVGNDHFFKCPECSHNMYIEKSFYLQEPGTTWKPYLRGIVELGIAGHSYRPFIFLVSRKPNNRISSCWFSYFKDLRKSGGKLKLGYGPGGPPNLRMKQIKKMVKELKQMNIY
jgi:hypothetical protein